MTDELRKGKEKVQTICSACHGLDGVAASGGNSVIIPNLTAQNKDYLIAKLKDYKSGKVNHPQMTLIAQMLTDDEIEEYLDDQFGPKTKETEEDLLLDLESSYNKLLRS